MPIASGAPDAPRSKTTSRLVQDLLDDAKGHVGGNLAWARLHRDVQHDTLRAVAWIRVQTRFDPEQGSAVRVEDLMQAMMMLYAREFLG
jgi:hypothetical protein